MTGMSGKLADLLVYRQWFGRTVVAKKPRPISSMSDKQQAVRDKFKLGAAYARTAIADSATQAIYKAKTTPGQTPFNMALADYFTMPVIGDIDVSGYTGKVGDKIKVQATDDFMVKSVDVSIAHADGTLLEQGAAVADPDGVHWLYTATVANAALSGSKITVTAKDLPANATVGDKVMP